jgi:hypothetical protein
MQPTTEKIDHLLSFWGAQDDDLADKQPADSYHRQAWQREKAELLALRAGEITVAQCKHACRFFNTMPAWGTYGT